MGPNAGRKALTLRTLPGRDPHESPADPLARADGFSLHAGVTVGARDSAKRERSEIAMPIGNGTLAATDLRDVAAVACRVFSEPGHSRQSYDLTGPELLTMHDVVERFSRVLGREVRYIDQPMDEFRARLKSINLPPWRIEAVVLELSALAAGVVDHTTDTMARLLGRPATSLEQFVRDHRALFGG